MWWITKNISRKDAGLPKGVSIGDSLEIKRSSQQEEDEEWEVDDT